MRMDDKKVQMEKEGNDIIVRGDTSDFLKQCLRLGLNFALHLIIMKMLISTTLAATPPEFLNSNAEIRVDYSDIMWEQFQRVVNNMSTITSGCNISK
jgi:hypothetical protein